MTDMVEKVGRALHAYEWEAQPNPEPYHIHKHYWEATARAAIRALMEPTEEMIRAGENSADSFPEDHYKAMLKATLDE